MILLTSEYTAKARSSRRESQCETRTDKSAQCAPTTSMGPDLMQWLWRRGSTRPHGQYDRRRKGVQAQQPLYENTNPTHRPLNVRITDPHYGVHSGLATPMKSKSIRNHSTLSHTLQQWACESIKMNERALSTQMTVESKAHSDRDGRFRSGSRRSSLARALSLFPAPTTSRTHRSTFNAVHAWNLGAPVSLQQGDCMMYNVYLSALQRLCKTAAPSWHLWTLTALTRRAGERICTTGEYTWFNVQLLCNRHG